MFLLLGLASLSAGAISLGVVLRRRQIRARNRELAQAKPLRAGAALLSGELRQLQGSAHKEGTPEPSPLHPPEDTVWVRYVLEELCRGWVTVLSEARPAQFRLRLDDEREVLVVAAAPQHVVLHERSSRVFGRTAESEFDSLFDEELPEEIQLCGAGFATRVEAERASRDSLFRVRIERILEGERVTVAGRVDDQGQGLVVGDAGSVLANVPASELSVVPSALGDCALASVGLALLGLGLWLFQSWGGL